MIAFAALATVITGPGKAAAAEAEAQTPAVDSQSGDDRNAAVVDDVIVRGHASGSGPKTSVSGDNDFAVTVGRLIDRLTFVNLTDRTNLIRPSEGIGIFQSAYGPRFTVLDSLTLAF